MALARRVKCANVCRVPARACVISGGKATVNSRGRRQLPTIHVWDIATGEAICTIKGTHQRAIACLAFSPDDKCVAACGAGVGGHGSARACYSPLVVAHVVARSSTGLWCPSAATTSTP